MKHLLLAKDLWGGRGWFRSVIALHRKQSGPSESLRARNVSQQADVKEAVFQDGKKKGTSIEAHIKDMKELTDRLAAINAIFWEACPQAIALL